MSAVTIVLAQTEPLNQPTAISFLGVKAYGMSISFAASDASSYLILRSTQPIVAAPLDGTSYQKGDWIGNAKVLAKGSNSFYTFREAVANTNYYFTVFAFNDGAVPNYKTDAPLAGEILTTGKNTEDYYEDYRIDTEESIQDLSDLLLNHTLLLYGNYDETVVFNLHQRDTTAGAKYVMCEYSNHIAQYTGTFDWLTVNYNREHVTPQAWMPSNPSSTAVIETADYFNLFNTYGPANQQRSNYPVGEVVTPSGTQYVDSKFGDNQLGDNVFEPKESIKGDVARTMFYQVVTYDGLSGSWAFNNLLTYGDEQDVDLLYQWHLQDPVDNFEIARNEYIYSIQGNRNPFVDFPEWVSCIDFKTLTLTGACPLDTAQIPDGIFNLDSADDVILYPNPTQNKSLIKFKTNEKIQYYSIENVAGKTVFTSDYINDNATIVHLNQYAAGIYFIHIYANDRHLVKKVLLQN